MRGNILLRKPNLDRTIAVRMRLASKHPILAAIALGKRRCRRPCGLDFAIEEFNFTGAAGAYIAFVRHTQSGAQGGTGNRVIGTARKRDIAIGNFYNGH